MNKLLIGWIGMLFLSIMNVEAQGASLDIVPKPSRIMMLTGEVILEGETPVYLDPKAKLNPSYISEILQEAGIRPVYVAKQKKAKLVVKLNKKAENSSEEAYRLGVMSADSKKQIVATADGRSGLLYALQTLRQMTEKQGVGVRLPVCIITDSPAFAWRAYMQDDSRHFQGGAMVKRLLDEMARLKMNTFHWHLVDDQGWRIEIKKYPNLTALGSKRDLSHPNLTPSEWDQLYPSRTYYTQDEIRDIVSYAADRGIRVIPEIEVPGHASASIYAYPWIGATSRKEGKAVMGDLYDVTDPKVERFLQDILDEVITLFPSKIVHIGGDEANYTHWKNSDSIQAFMKAHNLPTCSDLQVWSINRMSNYLASKGCKMIGWNEITGDNVRGEAHVEASQSESLAPGTIVQFWDGDISLVNKAIAKGYDVVNSNRFFTYLDYPYEVISFEKAYSFNPIPEGLSEKDSEKILGTGCQMWGEQTPSAERVYYQVFPRLAAYAECGWTPAREKQYDHFRKRLRKLEDLWKSKGYITIQQDKY